MSDEHFKGFIAGRHTERITSIHSQEQVRAESAEYPAISEHGVELSQQRSKEIKDMVDSAPRGTVLFFGGASEEQRTKSTVDVYGDTLQNLYATDPETLVFSSRSVGALHDDKRGIGNTVRAIETFIAQNPDKKIIVTFPLFLEEFSLRPDFRTKEAPHHLTDYSNALQPGGSAEHEAVEALLQNEGAAVTGDGAIVEGPSGNDIAEKYLRGINRLREFAQRYAADRPVMIGFVSHGLILDALTSYLANNGKANVEGFRKTGGAMIESSELAKVKIEKGAATLAYRGKVYSIPTELLAVS